jgi:ribonuclease HII
VQGDGRSLLIAGASVVAKVYRDQLMDRLDVDYPAYGWAANKGYGTRAHLLALRRHGATPVHRRSFQPVADVLQPGLFPAEPS